MDRIRSIEEFRFQGEPASGPLAPNGRRSNLPDDLHKKVRTPEFKQWFGDWENDPENASKILDANGEPLVVYHGTPSHGFESFINSYDVPRATDNETNSLGIWFSDDEEAAKRFMFGSEKGGVYRVFINVRNPKVFKPSQFSKSEVERLDDLIRELESKKSRLGMSVNDLTPEERKERSKIQKAIDDAWHQRKMAMRTDSFEQFMNYRDKYAEYGDQVEKGKIGGWLERYINTNKDQANKKLVQEFRSGGHDGVTIADTHYDARTKRSKISQYVVFDANSIKSVDAKRFDPSDDNIYESVKSGGSGIYNENKVEEMDTFDINKRKIKTFDQFLSTAEKVNKEDKKEHEIVKDGYSGDKDGKEGRAVLDTRKEEKGEHDTVKDAYSGERKGKSGFETLDNA
jgi:hypothetical protein